MRQKRRQKLRTAGRPASFVRDFSSYAKLCRLEQELEEPETFGHDYDDDVEEGGGVGGSTTWSVDKRVLGERALGLSPDRRTGRG